MNLFEQYLKKYAELIVKIGVNLQKGQILVINSPIECAAFTRDVAKIAYECGAKNVHVEWIDEELSLIKYLKAPEEALEEYPSWKAKGYEELAKQGAAFLSISASDPDLLKDVAPSRVAKSNKARSLALKKYREYIMNSTVAWTVVSIPTTKWAKKVFPKLTENTAVEKLWETLFGILRLNQENPVDAWNKHLKNLKEKVDFLNSKKFKTLRFLSKYSDLHIELPENHIWAGGGEYNKEGTYFVANMPTEEVFTLPLKTGVNGKIRSTKPFNYNGTLIEDFTITFKEGKAIEYTAEKGYETLKKLLETDEGSCYLGEVALVPYDSPISNSNVVFYNTLFDENASCHLAFGMAYPICLEEGDHMTPEELAEAGANQSLIHEDFMIGSCDLNILGETQNGEKLEIFKNGNWAF